MKSQQAGLVGTWAGECKRVGSWGQSGQGVIRFAENSATPPTGTGRRRGCVPGANALGLRGRELLCAKGGGDLAKGVGRVSHLPLATRTRFVSIPAGKTKAQVRTSTIRIRLSILSSGVPVFLMGNGGVGSRDSDSGADSGLDSLTYPARIRANHTISNSGRIIFDNHCFAKISGYARYALSFIC